VNIEDFIDKLESITPYIVPKEPRTLEQGEYLQTPHELELFEQYSSCINCLLCYAACPQYGLDDKFVGPAALALLHRYNADSRDGARQERMQIVNAKVGVWSCTAVGYCSEVCPKGVDPANAVNQNKVASAKDYFLRFVAPKGAAR
jgi:fumarate reductase iron-sulfur subunit